MTTTDPHIITHIPHLNFHNNTNSAQETRQWCVSWALSMFFFPFILYSTNKFFRYLLIYDNDGTAGARSTKRAQEMHQWCISWARGLRRISSTWYVFFPFIFYSTNKFFRYLLIYDDDGMVGARKRKKRPKRRHCDISWAIGILFFQTFFCLDSNNHRMARGYQMTGQWVQDEQTREYEGMTTGAWDADDVLSPRYVFFF